MVRHVTTSTCCNMWQHITMCYNMLQVYCDRYVPRWIQTHIKHDAAQINQQSSRDSLWMFLVLFRYCFCVCACLCLSDWAITDCKFHVFPPVRIGSASMYFCVLWSRPVTACHNMPWPISHEMTWETRNKMQSSCCRADAGRTFRTFPNMCCRTTARNSQALTGHLDQAFKAWQPVDNNKSRKVAKAAWISTFWNEIMLFGLSSCRSEAFWLPPKGHSDRGGIEEIWWLMK